jgi:hypothetical protein
MIKSPRKIVFIVGLSRTGSTMLDLVLGCNPKFVGLGEIFQVLRPDMNRFERNESCSCGKKTRECPFWGVVAEGLKEKKTVGLDERYRHTLQVFEDLYGPDNIAVDSSKLLDVLKAVVGLPQVEVKVIYLIRDVRAWTISRLNNRKNSPEYFRRDGYYIKKLAYQLGWKIHLLKWGLPFLTRLPVYYFLLWYLQNKQIKNYLENHHIEYFSLGYDELGMNPELMMKKIFEFLEEDIIDSNFCSVNSQSHILVGNTKKSESKRRQGIFYDNRWMYRNEWLRPAALLPKIMRYNAEEVYKNIKDHSIWDK